MSNLINFIDWALMPPKVDTDHERIQQIVNNAWQIAIKSNPRKGGYCASSNDDG